jgi:hypothetical protein
MAYCKKFALAENEWRIEFLICWVKLHPPRRKTRRPVPNENELSKSDTSGKWNANFLVKFLPKIHASFNSLKFYSGFPNFDIAWILQSAPGHLDYAPGWSLIVTLFLGFEEEKKIFTHGMKKNFSTSKWLSKKYHPILPVNVLKFWDLTSDLQPKLIKNLSFSSVCEIIDFVICALSIFFLFSNFL